MSRAVLTLIGVLILLPALAAEDRDPVQQAIDRGVAALKKRQRGDGTWSHAHIGCTALAGLTLLESGVSATDASVQKAANAVRDECSQLTHVYSLSLAILFFDRLGDPGDVPLIQTLAVRLLGCQNPMGGWSYDCPTVDPAESQRVADIVGQRKKAVGTQERPKLTPAELRDPRNLPKELQKRIAEIQQRGPNPQQGAGDNSNTQFATLALWVARRYGIPVDQALARIDARYRGSQNPDGGWAYIPDAVLTVRMPSTGSMTCAGLLGLAMTHGLLNEFVRGTGPRPKDRPAPAAPALRDPAKDPAVRAGLLALGTTIGQPAGPRVKGKVVIAAQGPGIRKGYYYLWSLERVAVAYSLETIGNKDWYAWGAQLLLASQDAEGTWSGEFTPDVDTCFALLFLRRANLARDLTVHLKGRVKDPGVVLRAGGVGAHALADKGLTTGLDFKDKTPGRPPDQPSADSETARLRNELVKAPAERQAKLLREMKETKGRVYTEALATAIPELGEAAKRKAREALAERLTRMTASTLRDQMKDVDVEIRRAAALACALKEEKTLIPELIALIEDPQPLVIRAAHAALRSLTNEDFGPGPDASRAERAKAAAAWKNWWKTQQPK
jgi:hypothetical protein